MANRRMFSKDVVCSDNFLDMPTSARALYYQIGMEADDDGFVGNPRTVIRMCGCSQDDMHILITNGFVRSFESGVILIVHWSLQNKIQPSRYKPTIYREEKNMLTTCRNDADIMPTSCRNDANKLSAQYSIGEISIDQNSIEEEVGKNDPPPLNRYVLDNVDLSPTGMESLVEFQKELDADVIRWAVDSAIDNGKRSWLYIERILVRCVEQNLRTLPDVQKAEAKRKAEKASKRVDGGKSVNDFQTHSYTESDFDDSFYYNFGDVNIGAG